MSATRFRFGYLTMPVLFRNAKVIEAGRIEELIDSAHRGERSIIHRVRKHLPGIRAFARASARLAQVYAA